MVTKGDKIAFALIAVLLVLAIVFRKDIASVFEGGGQDKGGKEKKKDKKDKDNDDDKKEGRQVPALPAGQQARTVVYTVRA